MTYILHNIGIYMKYMYCIHTLSMINLGFWIRQYPYNSQILRDIIYNFTRILLCAPFTLSIPFTSLSLSPLYPFHLSIPFISLSLSPLYPFHISISLSLYIYIYLSLSLSFSFYLSISLISPSLSIYLLLPFFLSLSLFSIILFGVSNGRFRPCFFE